MSLRGSFDFEQFSRFADKINACNQKKTSEFVSGVTRSLAVAFLSLVIPNTPVKTGALRRGWTGGTEVSAKLIPDLVDGIPLNVSNRTFSVKIVNNVKYARWVEYTRRTRVRKDGSRGVVRGRYMMKKAANAIESKAPSIGEEAIKHFIADLWR